MSVTTTNRDINALSDVAQQAVKLLFQECYKAGIHIFITETYRSQARQNYLYSIGRTIDKNKAVVTWTKSSRHTSRLAWDIAASTVKGNKNIYNTDIIKKAGAIAMKLGIIWGGQPSWVKAGATDYPHFEVNSNWKMPRGYKLEGSITIPTKSNQEIVLGKQNKVPVSIDDEDLEEVKKLSNYIAKVSDMTSPTLKASVLAKLKEAKNKGDITNDKWIKACEDGSLSIADLIGLLVHIEK